MGGGTPAVEIGPRVVWERPAENGIFDMGNGVPSKPMLENRYPRDSICIGEAFRKGRMGRGFTFLESNKE